MTVLVVNQNDELERYFADFQIELSNGLLFKDSFWDHSKIPFLTFDQLGQLYIKSLLNPSAFWQHGMLLVGTSITGSFQRGRICCHLAVFLYFQSLCTVENWWHLLLKMGSVNSSLKIWLFSLTSLPISFLVINHEEKVEHYSEHVI